ncbi:NUDIX domain-containing protein [Deinococcus sp. 23YEL01]|uniref:NUDIX hydrolase n=1 Tax=Deinococcus sp. 23YEL01 TaxID=2745871 RepID=UPI001E5B98AA|nr:NUDIX domain-containing protein [Deinococcus sp. 23YEL01]MCD0168258.1 NUDIX domain-containing protein [Deinococcus sp. 23YEL01]
MTAAEAQQEWLDLVNDHDEVIGAVTREDAYARGLTFRVINAFLINRAGQLWIPRRTAHKRLFPGCLDMSVGGHVERGETYEQAFRRETQEELNLNMDDLPWQQIASFGPRDGLSAFMHVYELRRDDPPAFNPDDFSSAQWLTPPELIRRIEQGDPAKGDLKRLVQLCYGVGRA